MLSLPYFTVPVSAMMEVNALFALLHSTSIRYDGGQRSHHQGWSYFTVPVSAMMEVNALFAKVGPTSQYPLS